MGNFLLRPDSTQNESRDIMMLDATKKIIAVPGTERQKRNTKSSVDDSYMKNDNIQKNEM